MDFKQRAKELVSKMSVAEKMSQLRYDAPAVERLGVPAYNWWNECLHGVARSGAATVFPQAIAMAASFNKRLIGEIAAAVSDEARAKYNEYKTFGDTQIYQGLTYWSPNINIFRDPRWGRGHETYGEDPCLTGVMAAEFIKGLQGELDNPGYKYRKLDATVKHFAAHSGPEKLRHGFNAAVSEEDMRDTYLRAFKYCVDNAAPSAVMGAYNRVNGEPCCASETLIRDILRGEWGFEGYFVSDCGAICDINKHHRVTETEAQSAALAVNGGCDLNCGSAYRALQAAYAEGLVNEEAITVCCERLFEARFRLGMFDDDCEYDNIPYDAVECEKHARLNLEMARESIVLLKNDGILPLRKENGLKLAVIGPNADDLTVLLGNYHGRPSKHTTFLKGIQDEAEKRGVKVRYAYGCHITDDVAGEWSENPAREAVLAARSADAVIMIMGLNASYEGEESDAYNGTDGGDRIDIELPKTQKRLYGEIKKTGKPVIFVNVTGSCINLSDQDENCAAVVQCFYPGAQGGKALADALFGNISPSGKLPVTFYKSADDLPPFEDYGMENRTYRYFKGTPLYKFGHGLSYTKFEVEEKGGGAFRVRNTGDYDGAKAVMSYDERGWLKGFEKVFLKKGEEKTITFSEIEKPF
ncbi:MAG: glycoside hydrolase family 3 C-terminal domain-containing protein [Oscillospiraceae bacterium]|jgi:beta-glucosidase|nr:glycoside hydrolase family 3 C-terminal domain-containing protein [Oscillospiraceae bacterium]